MKHIYLFSGLGADKRAFQFLDFTGFETTFIEWIKPQKKESLQDYVSRLAKQITSDRPILIGLSFGGMVAIEMAKIIEVEKIIIISSAKTYKEIPFYFRLTGMLRLHKLMPTNSLRRAGIVDYWLFGVKGYENKKLLTNILHDTDPEFLYWAIDKLTSWKNTDIPRNLTHIHGAIDRILPHRFINCDITINDGGHFMVIDKADEISMQLRKLLT